VLTSCANSPNGKALERSFAADPRLKDSSTLVGGSSQRNSQTTAQLPEDFPDEIPRYPQAQLNKVEPLTGSATQGKLTNWSSPDPINAIQNFYQRAFESGNWQIVSKPEGQVGGTLVARQNDLQVTVSIPSSAATSNSSATSSSTQPTPPQTTASSTNFDIQYIRNSGNTASLPSSSSQESPSPTAQPSVDKQPEVASPAQPQDFSDLDKVPEELRQHIQDLAALGVLTVNSSGAKSNSAATGTQFEPNKTLSRREFARWLVAANNQIYANRPGQQIRLASETSQPAFKDVPRSDPDFKSIQALAEAGLISSPLTGDSTALLFRPDAPLTRENLILWKVPLDTRQALPTASIDSVKQTWGFQDVAKIDPKALRAVLADFQSAEQSNIRRVFGYTTLFQPKKPVTRGEAAAAIWYFGSQGEGLSAKEALNIKSNPTPATPTPATPEETPKS
jgi:hypothetical protein